MTKKYFDAIEIFTCLINFDIENLACKKKDSRKNRQYPNPKTKH